MVEDDTFTYQIKQPPREHVNTAQENTAVHSLITKERTQKLDLLIHLLSNLPQSLIVCGPQGIGKTTLLTFLQERNTDVWRYCFVQGNADVSFEAIQKSLVQAFSDRQHKKVVLIVDDSGELVPGLISTVIQYAAANSDLSVIFALTHDEVQVKRGSDKAVEECHIVEIPTLSEKQCGDFLQHLSIKPAFNVSFKAITENMIAHIYRETHGVPGRIIAELSGLPRVKRGVKLKWLLVGSVAVALVIAIAFGLQWQVSTNDTIKALEPVNVEQKVAANEIAQSKPESRIMLPLPPVQPILQQQLNEAKVPMLSEPKAPALSGVKEPALSEAKESASSGVKVPVLSGVEVAEKPKQSAPALVPKIIDDKVSPALSGIKEPVLDEAKESVLKVEVPASVARIEKKPEYKQTEETQLKMAERLWAKQEKLKQAELSKVIMPEEASAFSVNNFTLQLMVLSKQASVDGILKKYPAMTSGLRAIKSLANGQEKFIVEYGSYPDAASANKAKQSLPAEFHNAMVRKIR